MYSSNALYCFDLIQIESGEILTLCGNFDGPWTRSRLSFYPCSDGDRNIGGTVYQKVKYETNYRISTCKKILNLPGEQHFLVHISQIIKCYKASDAFANLSDKTLAQCHALIDLLHQHCGLSKTHHGLTGSNALSAMLATSDFDWIIYERIPHKLETYITSDSNFRRELTFDMEHAYRKYVVFKNLTKSNISDLFVDRWKYFRFKDMSISVSFVDPLMRADQFLDLSVTNNRITTSGVILDDIGGYHMPRLIPVQCEHGAILIFSWLFLYNGAFKKGDQILFSGQWCATQGNKYVLVETENDYIRKRKYP